MDGKGGHRDNACTSMASFHRLVCARASTSELYVTTEGLRPHRSSISLWWGGKRTDGPWRESQLSSPFPFFLQGGGPTIRSMFSSRSPISSKDRVVVSLAPVFEQTAPDEALGVLGLLPLGAGGDGGVDRDEVGLQAGRRGRACRACGGICGWGEQSAAAVSASRKPNTSATQTRTHPAPSISSSNRSARLASPAFSHAFSAMLKARTLAPCLDRDMAARTASASSVSIYAKGFV